MWGGKFFAHKVVLQICIWSLNSTSLSGVNLCGEKKIMKRHWRLTLFIQESFNPPTACLKQSIPLSNWCTIVSGIEGEIIQIVKGEKRLQFVHYFILLSFKWYFGEIRNYKVFLSQKTYKLYIPALHNWLTYRPTSTHKCVFHMHPHSYRLAALATSSLI